MGILPPYHVARPRLIRRLAATPVGVIEAGGGYGKSVLAAEFAAGLGVASATAVLLERDRTPDRILARIHIALLDAGLTDLASGMESVADADAALEGLFLALRRERDPILLAIDEAHFAGAEGARLLADAARRLPPRHRLLIVGRRLPRGADTLRTLPQASALDGGDLAFGPAEIRVLFAGFGVQLRDRQVAQLSRATAGWPAALVLAAPVLARATSVDDALGQLGPRASLPELIGRQLDELSDADRAALVGLAHLTSIDADVVDAAMGAGLFERLVRAGTPFAPSARSGWALPGPVQEHVASLGPLRAETAAALATAYLARGRPGAALAAHVAGGDADRIAEFLANLSPEEAYQLDYVAIASAIDALPPDVFARWPRALIHFARACEGSFEMRRRSQALDRARQAAAAGQDDALLREVMAERARDQIRDGRPQEAAAVAAEVLAWTGPGELDTRARALDVLGRARAWDRDATSLASAEALLEEAHALYRSRGRRTWTAQIVMPLAIHVHFARARYDVAVQRLDEALEGLAGRDRLRAVILTFRAQVLHEAGRFAEAEASLAEAWALGEQFGDARILAYAAWEAAVGASQQGDRERTLERLRAADERPGDWFEHDTGAEFLAAASDASRRVGDEAAARRYLGRALGRVGEAPLPIRLAEAAVEAEWGDPDRASALLAAVAAMPRLEPREAWRVTLFRALAAARAADAGAADLIAQAYGEAAALGHPTLPVVREPGVARRLATLAAGNAMEPVVRVEVRALGEFAVSLAGRAVPPPPGLPASLVKYVVARGGRVPAEEASEALWPDADPEAGRRGLRNALLRLNASHRGLLVRDGTLLRLADDVDADVAAFERAAGEALSLGRVPQGVVLARSAVAQYRGDLLPDEPYAEWAAALRERLRTRFLRLLDLLITAASERRDLDESVAWLERAIEADPYDESRYLRAAEILVEQGRRARAIAILKRGEVMLAALGVAPPQAYRRLESRLTEPVP